MTADDYEILLRAGEDYLEAATSLDEVVQARLRDGWALYGPMQMSVLGSEVIYAQVMIMPGQPGRGIEDDATQEPG